MATGSLIFAGYEFCHCVQHLPFTPASRWLREIKKHHLAHHFHSERGNFGITLDWWDRILGTEYESRRQIPRSPTTHNLGYTDAERDRYPWVGELSASAQWPLYGGVATYLLGTTALLIATTRDRRAGWPWPAAAVPVILLLGVFTFIPPMLSTAAVTGLVIATVLAGIRKQRQGDLQTTET